MIRSDGYQNLCTLTHQREPVQHSAEHSLESAQLFNREVIRLESQDNPDYETIDQFAAAAIRHAVEGLTIDSSEEQRGMLQLERGRAEFARGELLPGIIALNLAARSVLLNFSDLSNAWEAIHYVGLPDPLPEDLLDQIRLSLDPSSPLPEKKGVVLPKSESA